MTSDEELMSAVAAGDMDAFETLVRRHQQRALNVAYRFLGDRHEAEDLAQEAFLRVLNAAPSYRPTAKFSTYLYRVLANACLDYRAKKRPDFSDSVPSQTDTADAPDEAMERDERRGRVRQAIDNLPERQRMALILQHYEDMSYEEVAEAMECSKSAVDSLLVRAKRNLRDALAEEG
jgi:RNA polymerase sigma-70 factor (ECF subfamily)